MLKFFEFPKESHSLFDLFFGAVVFAVGATFFGWLCQEQVLKEMQRLGDLSYYVYVLDARAAKFFLDAILGAIPSIGFAVASVYFLIASLVRVFHKV